MVLNHVLDKYLPFCISGKFLVIQLVNLVFSYYVQIDLIFSFSRKFSFVWLVVYLKSHGNI